MCTVLFEYTGRLRVAFLVAADAFAARQANRCDQLRAAASQTSLYFLHVCMCMHATAPQLIVSICEPRRMPVAVAKNRTRYLPIFLKRTICTCLF